MLNPEKGQGFSHTPHTASLLSPSANAARKRSFDARLQLRLDRVWNHLWVRRWLIVLSALIFMGLSATYGIPWYACTLALAAFALGAALIPRGGLPLLALTRAPADAGSEAIDVAKILIDALPDPAIVLDRAGTILLFNGKAGDLFESLKPGFHISRVLRNPQVLDALTECGSKLPTQTAIFSEKVPFERHMAATVSFLRFPREPRNSAILLVLHDLTEQRRLDQLRADFIANASHEIKTPLTSILGFIETLRGAARQDEAARERFLAIMAQQAERMARLIDSLMSLSRVEMRAHLKPQDPVQIAELVAEARHALEPMAAEAEIHVEVRSQLNSVTVLGDKDELTQVFLNLIHNAIKYGRPGGRVVVDVNRIVNGSAPKISIAIEDDGPGIAVQHLPRLTERFYRIPGSSALEKGGTGLGLAIVKHVVNRHRGELRISSQEGIGSKFTVILAEHKADRDGAA